jgi:hypothetical protein
MLVVGRALPAPRPARPAGLVGGGRGIGQPSRAIAPAGAGPRVLRMLARTFATIGSRMRFDRPAHPEPPTAQPPQHAAGAELAAERAHPGQRFPADEIVWGIVVRNGFDELDDPRHHVGTTQHAYLEGHDQVAICGFRPPLSGPRSRRRARLGLPTSGIHPMCGMCARLVVAPRPRVPVPVYGSRPPVAVPVVPPAPQPQRPAPVGIAAAPATGGPSFTPPPTQAHAAPLPAEARVSPWVRERAAAGQAPDPRTIDFGTRHSSGLLERGVHAPEQD